MRTPTYFLLHVVFPTLVGSAIYLGWRTTTLWVFKWLEIAGVQDLVVRPSLKLPYWVLYSLPDGCWVYATTSWMMLIWGKLTPWALVTVILSVGSEFGQLFGFLPGTYDSLDVIFYFLGFVFAVVIYEKANFIDSGDLCNVTNGFRERGQ